jgi:hypothetical protein
MAKKLDPSSPTRRDGSVKSKVGFLGPIPNLITGGTMTEFSTDMEVDGKSIDIPTMVPTLTYEELEYLRTLIPGQGFNLKNPIELRIINKARSHAMKRLKEGKSPYYQDDEDRVKKAAGDEVSYLQKPNNFQAAIDLLRNPADVGSIEPISELEVLTSKPITDPVTKNLFESIKGVKEFFLPEPKFSDPLSLLDYLATSTVPGRAAKVTSKGVGSLFSDEAAEFLLRAEKEMKDLSDLQQRKERLRRKADSIVDTSKTDDLSDVQKELDIVELEEKNIDDRIFKVTQKFNKKTSYKFDKFLEPRYIPSLAPKQGSIGKENVLKVTKAKKDRDILEKTGARFDSPGFDDFYQSSYGATKLISPSATRRVLEDPEYFSNKFIGPFKGDRPVKVVQEGGQEIQMPLNPLEKLELNRMSTPTTAIVGRNGESFFFADPKKLENLLIRSSSGDDFFKLRKSDPEYLEDLEMSIRRKGYQPNPVQIEVLPSGNISIMEGNHRLFRALKEGEKEIPVEIQYVAGAERLDSALPINNLSRIVADGSKGFKTNKEYATYVQDINKKYLGDIIDLQKDLNNLRKAESMKVPGAPSKDIKAADKIKEKIPYGTSEEIEQKLLELQGSKQMDLDLFDKLRKEYDV